MPTWLRKKANQHLSKSNKDRVTSPRLRIRFMRWFAGTCLTLLLAGIAVSWIVAGKLVQPNRHSLAPPPAELNAQEITLESQNGCHLKGWHCRSEDSKGVILLLHGIYSSRESMLDRALFLCEQHYSVVMIDLQAHGESEGDYITVGSHEQHDVEAAVEFAKSQHPGEPVGIIGVSLGGASVLLASPLGIDALIIESVFPTIQAAIHNRVDARLGLLSTVPAEILLFQLNQRLGIDPESLRPIDSIADVGCPLLIISGEDDPHTPASETEEMFEAAREPKQLWLISGAKHENLHVFAKKSYEDRVLKFLENSFNSQ